MVVFADGTYVHAVGSPQDHRHGGDGGSNRRFTVHVLLRDPKAEGGWKKLDYVTQKPGGAYDKTLFVELPDVGTKLKAGQSFGNIESVKAVSELFAPVSGEVIAVNPALKDKPESVNSEPHATWMVKVCGAEVSLPRTNCTVLPVYGSVVVRIIEVTLGRSVPSYSGGSGRKGNLLAPARKP